MTFNFGETFNINGANGDKSGLTFFNDTFWINKPSTPTPGWKDVTVTGEDSLNLPNAKADGLNYLKAYGKCYQGNLPYGFTQLESISGISLKAWFDTGVAGDNDNLRFVFTGYKSSGVAYSPFFGNYANESSNVTRLIAGASSGIIAEVNRKSASSTTTNSTNYLVAHTYELYKENGVSILKVDGTQVDTMANSSGTANPMNIGINTSRPNPNTPSSDVMTTFKGIFQIYDGTTLIRNYVMAKRDSDNAVGMYDTVNDTFKASEGTENFTAGADLKPLPTYPLAITCNNGVVKYGAIGKNLYNVATRTDGYYISATGVITAEVHSCYSALIPVKPNTYYTYSGRADDGNKRMHAYDSSGNWIQQIDYVSASQASFSVSGQTPANCRYVRISGLKTDVSVQLELGSIATSYEPYQADIYTDGTTETIKDSLNNTATCENLLSAGTYKDVQSILDGTVTRNIGVKVLTGDEDWAKNATRPNAYSIPLNSLPNIDASQHLLLCTHFTNTQQASDLNYPNYAYAGTAFNVSMPTTISTVDQLKDYFKQQYANHTPVIVIFPLATAVTETVTAQTLTTKRGDNTIEITQASLGDLTLEAEYQAGVTVTIEEVEEANLDNNVTVVIGE